MVEYGYITGFENARETEKYFYKFAGEGLKLVTFPFTASGSQRKAFSGDIHNYGGPYVWLSLIRDVEYVVTDSFYAVVFSISYQKRFVIFCRSGDWVIGSMNPQMY